MKQKISETIAIPGGVTCSYEHKLLKCNKGSNELSRKINAPDIEIKVNEKEVILGCEKGNKNQYKLIKSLAAHVNNLFHGLDKKFVYELESANVHFPMTLKVDGDKFVISNFLGEKNPRIAKILPNVQVEVKGPKITVSSHDREAAGQTAANLEKATKIRGRDRRIFQDGIYIVEKPGREK